MTGLILAFPAETLVLKRAAFRFWTHQRRIACAVRLAEGVAAGDEGNGFLVVHRHTGKGFADVARRSERIGIAVRAFRIDVDKAHLNSAQRLGKLAFTAIALVTEPGAFRTPIQLFRLPNVDTAAGEAEGLEAHRFQRGIAGQDHQIRPGQLAAIFLLDRPQHAARLVEVGVIRPGIQRRKTLLTGTCAAAPVGDAIGAGRVPGHADHETAIMTEVGRPPILVVGHEGLEVRHDGIEVERLEFFGVVEIGTHRVGQVRVAVKHFDVERIRPPAAIVRPLLVARGTVLVTTATAMGYGALALGLIVGHCIHDHTPWRGCWVG